jgi:hypothetical protein
MAALALFEPLCEFAIKRLLTGAQGLKKEEDLLAQPDSTDDSSVYVAVRLAAYQRLTAPGFSPLLSRH